VPVNAVVIPLGVEPAEPSRDDWQVRVIHLLVEPGVITWGDRRLRDAVPSGRRLRDYLRYLQRQGFIRLPVRPHDCPHCECGKKERITITDYGALRRMLRESDPRHYSAMHRTGQIAGAGGVTTSESTVT
jgi:hypothetical protein